MALKFKNGDEVRQVVPTITGKVVGKALVGDEIQYCVEWVDAGGENHRRFFNENEIEINEIPPAQG